MVRGGRALLEFVLAYPNRVRTLTLVEPAAYWILEQLDEHRADIDQANDLIHKFSGQVVTEDDLAEFLGLAGLVQPGEDARQHPLWDRWLPHRMALSWQSEELDRSGRSVDELVNIRCPVLLVRGDVTTETDKRVVAVLAEQLPNATLVELLGDHAAHIQSIDAFLEALENHLATA